VSQATLPGIPESDVGDLEFWATPPSATEAILPLLPRRLIGGRCILIEPAAGRGAILDVAIPYVLPVDWCAYELDRARCSDLQREAPRKWPSMGSVTHANFLNEASPITSLPGAALTKTPLLFFTNPPYSIATEFVEKCVRLADAPAEPALKGAVVMMLQHDFATGDDRCERVHWKWKSSLYPLRTRPKCGNNSTGMRPFSWFIWDLAEPKSEWRPIG
jgi:hypothetical protein